MRALSTTGRLILKQALDCKKKKKLNKLDLALLEPSEEISFEQLKAELEELK